MGNTYTNSETDRKTDPYSYLVQKQRQQQQQQLQQQQHQQQHHQLHKPKANNMHAAQVKSRSCSKIPLSKFEFTEPTSIVEPYLYLGTCSYRG